MADKSPLAALSDALADAVAAVEPSLVTLIGTRAPATGTVWDGEGHVVTAAHLLGPRDEGQVELYDGTRVAARVIAQDPTTDVALLKLAEASPTPAPWAGTEELRLGHLVFALGRPGGRTRAVLGAVAGLHGEWKTRAGGRLDRLVEVDQGLPPGFSGGPLVDAHGRAVAMNSHALRRGGAPVPHETLVRVVAALLDRGSVRRGYLGVGVQTAVLDEARTGVLVTSIDPDGPARAAGMLLGDVILTLDGEAMPDADTLLANLAHRGDQRITLGLSRAGEAVEATVTLASRAPGSGRARGPRRRGFRFQRHP